MITMAKQRSVASFVPTVMYARTADSNVQARGFDRASVTFAGPPISVGMSYAIENYMSILHVTRQSFRTHYVNVKHKLSNPSDNKEWISRHAKAGSRSIEREVARILISSSLLCASALAQRIHMLVSDYRNAGLVMQGAVSKTFDA
jgi:hypothetical protein